MVLSNSDYQQLQIDTAFLKLNFWPFVTDTNAMSALLDEVMVSAFQRVNDPRPLDFSVLLLTRQ
jgi:hypothetical protein